MVLVNHLLLLMAATDGKNARSIYIYVCIYICIYIMYIYVYIVIIMQHVIASKFVKCL